MAGDYFPLWGTCQGFQVTIVSCILTMMSPWLHMLKQYWRPVECYSSSGVLSFVDHVRYHSHSLTKLLVLCPSPAHQSGCSHCLCVSLSPRQLLNILAAGVDVLEHNAFDSEDISLALNFTAAAPSSRLFGPNGVPAAVVDILATQSVTANLHHDGVTPSTFNVS